MRPLQRLRDLAEGQWGLVTLRQANDARVGWRSVARLAEAGLIQRVGHGVYRIRGATEPDHLNLRAAWLQIDPGRAAWERLDDPDVAVISHTSAAALYGVGDLRADVHEFTLPRRRQTRRQDVRLHRGRVPDDKRLLLRGLPTTRAARMIGDLIGDNVDPDNVAQITVEVLDQMLDYAGVIAESLAPHAERFGLAEGDGAGLLDDLLKRAQYRDRAEVVTEARRQMSERYAAPQALRQAVEDRLRRFAMDHPGAQLADLQRQFAYDRLLSRVFRSDEEGWILKGATAMLSRLGGLARHTTDIDLYRQHGDLKEAEDALRAAASFDLGDHFRFTLNPGRHIVQDGQALRIPVVAYLGASRFAEFHVDLVAGIEMTGVPDEVSSLVAIDVPGLVRTHYRAYPVVDHVADKVCAMLELHEHQGQPSVRSTRYRDLADLAIFAHGMSMEAEPLRRAIASEGKRRGLELPSRLPTPDGPRWRAGYARVARDAPMLQERDLDSALQTVRKFIDPVLLGVAAGSWNPDTLEWSGEN